MSDTEFDQNAWLARIGYSGPVTPTLATLNQLIFAHSHSIAYETLDIMLGLPPKLDVPTLQHKMIARKRGGYCFEQNMLFRAGLRSLGYKITSLQGRVVRGLAIDVSALAISRRPARSCLPHKSSKRCRMRSCALSMLAAS
jgi:N-hydroxyarylamine O-acetyltransferase